MRGRPGQVTPKNECRVGGASALREWGGIAVENDKNETTRRRESRRPRGRSLHIVPPGKLHYYACQVSSPDKFR